MEELNHQMYGPCSATGRLVCLVCRVFCVYSWGALTKNGCVSSAIELCWIDHSEVGELTKKMAKHRIWIIFTNLGFGRPNASFQKYKCQIRDSKYSRLQQNWRRGRGDGHVRLTKFGVDVRSVEIDWRYTTQTGCAPLPGGTWLLLRRRPTKSTWVYENAPNANWLKKNNRKAPPRLHPVCVNP